MQLARPGSGRLVRADHLVHELSALPDDQARAVVESLPAVDLLWLTRRLPHADALMLVEYASHDQVARMIDLDAWRGDQMDLPRFLEWAGTLSEVSQEKAVAFLAEVDEEYPALSLLKAGRVADRRDIEEGDAPFDEETEEAIPTPDQQFVVVVPREDPIAAPIRALIDFLYAGDLDHARLVLQAARWELPSVVEENLLHFRAGRLEEMGIPSLARAWRLFRPLSAEQESRLFAAPKLGDVGLASERLTDALLAPLERAADPSLEAAVQALTDEQRARFAQAAVYAAHKVAVTRGDDPGDQAALTSAMQVVADHLRLALAVLAPRADATRALSVHPEVLFRLAHTRLVSLRQRAHAVLAPLGGHAASARFSSPWRDVLEGLLLPVPRFMRPGLSRLDDRAFLSADDLDEARDLLDVVARQAVFFADLAAAAPDHATAPYACLLATGLSNHALGKGWRVRPLAASELPSLAASLVSVRAGVAAIHDEVRAQLLSDFQAWLASAHPERAFDPAFQRDLRVVLGRCLDDLAGALGTADGGAFEAAGVASGVLLVEGEDVP